MSEKEERHFTAEEAMFELERAAAGLSDSSGQIGRMKKEEAQKLASFLFAVDGEEMPEEIKRFFDLPE